jgi:hypothetical protein
MFCDFCERKRVAQFGGVRRPGSRIGASAAKLSKPFQAAYDLKTAEQNKKVMQRVARILPVGPAEELRA